MIVRELAGARVVFSDRHGGVSRPPYASANLAFGLGDDAAVVAENRRRLAERLGPGVADPSRWVWLRQVHGATVHVAGRDPSPVDPPEADASVTVDAGVPLVVLTADCAPIALVADGVVAAVHAGWQGLERGVVDAAVAEVRARADGTVRGVLGPCIRPERYEFGAELLDRLVDRLGPGVAARTTAGTPALDIPAAVRSALAAVDVPLDDVGVCTSGSDDHFSYRRDGVTGRQALVVWRA